MQFSFGNESRNNSSKTEVLGISKERHKCSVATKRSKSVFLIFYFKKHLKYRSLLMGAIFAIMKFGLGK